MRTPIITGWTCQVLLVSTLVLLGVNAHAQSFTDIKLTTSVAPQTVVPGGRAVLTLTMEPLPFAGAGTTVLAAVQEGYEAVGVEMSDAYFRRSAERLKTALESEVNQN